MLEKKNFNFDVEEEMGKTTTMTDNKGNEIVLLERIPYEEKFEFVRELAERVLVGNEEVGLCYKSSMYDLMFNYLYVKHYTNIDVAWVETAEDFRKLYDYCDVSGLTHVCPKDFEALISLWENYSNSVIELYERKNSLGALVKSWLGTDIDTNKEETRELIEKLIDMKGALLEKEENEKVIQFAKANKKVAPLKTGGAKLSFAKKK